MLGLQLEYRWLRTEIVRAVERPFCPRVYEMNVKEQSYVPECNARIKDNELVNAT